VSRDFPTEQEYDSLDPDNFWVSSFHHRADRYGEMLMMMAPGFDDFSSSDWTMVLDTLMEMTIQHPIEKIQEPTWDFVDDSIFRDLQNHLAECEQFWNDTADSLSGWCSLLPPYRDLTRSTWAGALAVGKNIPGFEDFLDSEVG
jgi:hypothetical protein